jgi:hypothetical protein
MNCCGRFDFPIAKHGLSHFSHRSLLLNELLWQTTHTFHWRLTSELLVTILNVDVYLISDVQHLYQSWNTHISVMETTNQTYPNFSRNIPHLIQWMSMYNNIKKVTLLVLDMYHVVFVHQCKHYSTLSWIHGPLFKGHLSIMGFFSFLGLPSVNRFD